MASDQDHPSRRAGHSIYVDPDIWLRLRQHALSEGVPASSIVATLVQEYVGWPAALQAATLRRVRGQPDNDGGGDE